ncbi:MAG: glycosyltransferase family 39 protein, partial [Candidatus Zixiibacteriota bacterium]
MTTVMAPGGWTRKGYWWLLAVMAAALIVRVVYLVSYSQLPDWDQLTVDNYYHHNWAQSIADGNILGDTTYFRAPFYVWCLGLLYALFGASLWVARVFGLLVGLASILMTYLIGRKLFSPTVGLLAALLHSLFPVMIYFESELLLDPTFTLLLQLSVFQFLIWREKKTISSALRLGLLLGLACITRPTALVFAPAVILSILFGLRSWRQRLFHVLVFGMGTLVFTGVVFARNLAVARDPVLISSQGGINLYIGNNEAADGISAVLPEPLGHNWELREISFIAERDAGHSLKPGDVSGYWTRRAVSWIVDNPGAFLLLFLKKLYFSVSDRMISNNRDLGSFFRSVPVLKHNPLSFGLIFALAIVAAVAALRREYGVRLLVVLIVIYSFALSFFFFNSRFRLPVTPFYLLLASFGVRLPVTAFRDDKRRLVIGVTFGVGAALLSFLPVYSLQPWVSPQALISKGLYFYSQGEIDRALSYHRLALAVDSTFPEVNLNMGVCFFRQGDEDSARCYFEREARLHPLRAKSWVNLASLELVNGRVDQALAYASRAVEKRPFD